MKLLLAVTMTMLFAGSAFGGACSKDNTKECTQDECKKMNYTWTKGSPDQCLSPEGPVVTNCPESADGKRDNNAGKVGAGLNADGKKVEGIGK